MVAMLGVLVNALLLFVVDVLSLCKLDSTVINTPCRGKAALCLSCPVVLVFTTHDYGNCSVFRINMQGS